MPVKFACLENKSVVEAEVSDHNPVIYAGPLGYTFCTFNILMRCAHGNNGFGRIETEEEYQIRLLEDICNIIQELTEEHKVDFLLLQEAPPPEVGKAFYAKLKDILTFHTVDPTNMYMELDWSKAKLQGISASGGVFTIYDSNLTATEITSDVKLEICNKNQKRFQAFNFNYTATRGFKVANFHADFADQEGTKNDVIKLLAKEFLVGGDFNLLEEPKVKVPEQAELTDPTLNFPHRTYDAIYDGRKFSLVLRACMMRL